MRNSICDGGYSAQNANTVLMMMMMWSVVGMTPKIVRLICGARFLPAYMATWSMDLPVCREA